MAFFLADAETAYSAFDDTADQPSTLVALSADADLLVRVQMVFEIEDGIVVSARQDGQAHVSAVRRYDESEDALADLVEALSAVPGLEGIAAIDWQERSEDEDEVEYTVPSGQTVAVSRVEGEFGGGLSVRVGDREATAVCHYDYTAWMGGREGGYMEPPYVLRFADSSSGFGRGAWGLSAWTVAELFGKRPSATKEPLGDV